MPLPPPLTGGWQSHRIPSLPPPRPCPPKIGPAVGGRKGGGVGGWVPWGQIQHLCSARNRRRQTAGSPMGGWGAAIHERGAGLLGGCLWYNGLEACCQAGGGRRLVIQRCCRSWASGLGPFPCWPHGHTRGRVAASFSEQRGSPSLSRQAHGLGRQPVTHCLHATALLWYRWKAVPVLAPPWPCLPGWDLPTFLRCVAACVWCGENRTDLALFVHAVGRVEGGAVPEETIIRDMMPWTDHLLP